MTGIVENINLENAQSLLIDESFKRPVLVDFWADWCGPCKSLMPILEKLAQEHAGAFLLAKVNADEMQMIASQFGVRSLPTVMLIKDGQPLDGFTGVKSEQEISDFLAPHLPNPWDLIVRDAEEKVAAGELEDAQVALRAAYQESHQKVEVALELANVLVMLKRFDEAEQILAKVKMADQNERFQQVKAALALAQEAQKAPEIMKLEEQLALTPEDGELRYQLAMQYSQHDYKKEALDLLYALISKDLNFNAGEAKKMYLDIIATMGKGDPIAVSAQRRLYNLIY